MKPDPRSGVSLSFSLSHICVGVYPGRGLWQREARYLVQAGLEDLEGHGEGQGAAPAAVAQVTQGGVAHHGAQVRIITVTPA